ncbi:MAG TPA: ATP-grasp domain-containing protein, partial [Terriglobia bacterium]|nr:ATP-grasp domain-containing protein [Terriglobia bacterium]
MKKVNVLITAASRRVPLVRAFRNSVEKLGRGRVITTDINPMSPALYFGHKHHIVPLTTDKYYIPIIESICDAEDVNLVVPTIDDELPIFGRSLHRFEQVGIEVAVSSERTSNICNDKYETYLFCEQNGIPAPKTRMASEVNFATLEYPVYVKPRFGRGSVNVYLVQNETQLRLFLDYVPGAIVQDQLVGTEFTVDVLADFNGRVLSVVPRERLVIRAGVSDKGVTRKNPAVMAFAKNVAERLQIVGPANIQCKWDGQNINLIEVNPRFSGGIPLTIAAGADFTSWLVQLRAGVDVCAHIGEFQDGLAMMSFEESIFATEAELKLRQT